MKPALFDSSIGQFSAHFVVSPRRDFRPNRDVQPFALCESIEGPLLQGNLNGRFD
jgi:hypothetical protein